MNPDPELGAKGGASNATPDAEGTKPALTVIGIGGSAGALQALIALLEAVRADIPAAIVVVLHLAPDQESSAAEILQRVTPLAVSQVRGRMLLKAGHVYVIAPGMNLITDDGHVRPDKGKPKRPSTAIDLFFRSLATVHRERAVGIVLSGTGRDGSLGLAHVKECDGLTIAQAPEDCEHAEMPRAAMATGQVDLVLPAVEIGKRLNDLVTMPRLSPSSTEAADAPAQEVQEGQGEDQSASRAFQDILTSLRVRTRHDFRHYKRATVTRRIERRMVVNGQESLQAYRDFVRNSPEELSPLLADMLISVTNFFRDPKAFDALQQVVVPQVMQSVAEGEEARIWIPACASGEESYSVAILLQEYIDRMPQPRRVQIFASDINEDALSVARAGIYPTNIAADVTESRLLAFFEKEEGDRYRVRSTLREMIMFARHNVLGDPPFSRLDLVCCRNLLIYLDRSAQATVLEMFAYALKPGGYLFLGNAESVDADGAAFEIISKQHRIYRLRPEGAARAHTRLPTQLVNLGASAPPAISLPLHRESSRHQEQPLTILHERALVSASPPSVLIDGDQEIVRVSPGAGRFIAFGEGVPILNLLNNVAPDIRTELRAALFRASELQQPVHSIFRRSGADDKSDGSIMELSIHPVDGVDRYPSHWLVLFDELVETSIPLPNRSLATDHNGYEAAIRRLEDENRSLKGHLQETLDRSAVSNEDLKASNEELQAINEELRSAKEELETSREELQSINEELTTVNFELHMKVEEASQHNDDLRNLIEASDVATVFVDPGLRVKRFTPLASKLFSLLPSDIGRPLMDVKSRLQYDEIVDDASAVFKQLRPVERAIRSIDGEHFFARVLPYRTSQDKIGGAVLTFVNVTELRRAEDRAKRTEERLRDAISTSRDFAVMSTDADGIIMTWNEGATRIFGHDSNDIVGQPIDVLFTADDRAAGAPEQERSAALRDGRASDERWHLRRDGTTFFCSGVLTPLQGGDGAGFLKIARDVSDFKDRELRQREDLSHERRASAEIKAVSDLKDRFLAVMSHELKQPLNLIQVNAELLVRLPEPLDSPTVQRLGSTIMRAVSAQETIVNDLLDLSRVQTGKLRLQREPTDVVEIIRRLCQAITPDAARKGVALEFHAPRRAMCHCDPVRIEQVVWNLLGNALKFTPEGGRIAMRVACDESEVKFEVADTGLGIPEESLTRVFDLFSQGSAAEAPDMRRAGLGIGLALVRELVQAHGGRIAAASPGSGKGATFTVWLPLTARAPASTSGDSPSASLRRRILMVDDDGDALAAFATLLEMEGASVDSTTSPSEALSMLTAGAYDLLLSDIDMPGMSGFELMERARELRPMKHFRSVAITGYGREADARDALSAGFDAHVSKPISIARLKAALDSLGH